MYKAFYGLKEDPFSITPDPRFLYWSPKHQEAFRHLVYGVQGNKGLVALTGEPGTGKTAILHALTEHLSSLYPNIHIAFLVNSKINVQDLFSLIFDEFHIEHRCHNKSAYLIALKHFLAKSQLEKEKSVIMLDEAQNFHPTILEEIRLLSNIETASEKLLNIVLVGQPKLLEHINTPGLAQLKQRLGIIYKLSPLNRQEMALYIHKRLSVAGAPEVEIFTPDALDELFAYTQGLPRLINVICDNALLFGSAANTHQINREIIRRVAQDMDITLLKEGLASDSGLSGHAVATAGAFPALVASGTPLASHLTGPQRSSSEVQENSDDIILKNSIYSIDDWDKILLKDPARAPRYFRRFFLIALVLLLLLGGIIGEQFGLLSFRGEVSRAWEALRWQLMSPLDTSPAPAKATGRLHEPPEAPLLP